MSNGFAIDPDYERFTGRPVALIQGRRWDWSTCRFVPCEQVVFDIGRSDPVAPADGDEAMQRERLPREPKPKPQRVIQRKTDDQRRWVDQIVDLLRTNGPMTAGQIARQLGMQRQSVNGEIKCHWSYFVVVDSVPVRGGWAHVYSLAGTHGS